MSQLPPGASPTASDVLTIGNVSFLDEECPSNLDFGLKKALAVFVNVGGSRTIQDMGPNPSDISWSGRLWANNVQPRLAALKALEVAGQPVSLTYLTQSYQVLIREFIPKYHHRWLAEYSITVTVLSDTSGQYAQRSPNGIGGQVNGVSQAAQKTVTGLSSLDSLGTASIQAAFAALFAAIAGAGELSQLTGAPLQTLITLAGQAYNAANDYAGKQSPSTPQFIMASQLASYATIITKNLSQGQAPRVTIKQGGDLFDTAAQFYGDISLGFALASANGLITPLLSSDEVYQIILPPLPESSAA